VGEIIKEYRFHGVVLELTNSAVLSGGGWKPSIAITLYFSNDESSFWKINILKGEYDQRKDDAVRQLKDMFKRKFMEQE
jgi:hypothetical protein